MQLLTLTGTSKRSIGQKDKTHNYYIHQIFVQDIHIKTFFQFNDGKSSFKYVNNYND